MISEQERTALQRTPQSEIPVTKQSFDYGFRRACKKLKRAKKSQVKFEREFERVVQYYCDEVLPKERAILLGPSCELIEHLIQFLPKPSLTDDSRQALLNWLDSLISNVSRLDSALADSLRERVKGSLCQIIRNAADPETVTNMNQLLADMDQEADEVLASTTQEPSDQDSSDQAGSIVCNLDDEDDFLNARWFTILFRKTAQAVHPDREPDPELAQEKAGLMARLLGARQQGDIFTVLELYSEHVAADPELGQLEMSQVLTLIQRQIDQVKLQRHELIMRSSVRALAYDRLYAQTRQQQQAKVKTAMTHFYDVRYSLIYCRKRIKSVSQLVDFLK